MSEFKDGYIDAYRADILSMLDLADELSLVYRPDVVIRGKLSHMEDMDIDIPNLPLDGEAADSVESIQALTNKASGLMDLQFLSSMATVTLFAAEVDAVIPSDAPDAAQQQELLDSIVGMAKDQIQQADYTYTASYFINNESGDQIAISSSRLHSAVSPVRAQKLSVTISDTYIQKTFTVSMMPVSFDGETKLEVEQTIVPVQDETFRAAAELFYSSDAPDDMSLLISIFTSELTGRETDNDEMADLMARYEATGKADVLRRIVEEVKQKANAAKINSAFTTANPEMTLPSAAELEYYQALLSQLRA